MLKLTVWQITNWAEDSTTCNEHLKNCLTPETRPQYIRPFCDMQIHVIHYGTCSIGLIGYTVTRSESIRRGIPGVHVWNVDFRQWMVHQCSLYYNNLILHHFVVSTTSASDKLEKCAHRVVLLCSVWRNLYWTKSIRGQQINFLLSFEEDCCWIILRDAYGEHAPTQNTRERWFQHFKSGDFGTRQDRRQRTWKTVIKTGRCGIVGRRWFAYTTTTRRAIAQSSTSYFQSTTRYGKD